MDEFQGGSAAICQFRPASVIQIRHLIDQGIGGITQPQPVAAVGQSAAELGVVHHEETTSGQLRARGKSIIDGIAEPPAGEVHRQRAGVVQLNPFRRIFGKGDRGGGIGVGGACMIGNFIDHDRARQDGSERGGYRGGAIHQTGGEVEDDVGRRRVRG